MKPSLPDIATAIMICEAVDTIPGFAVTWGYVDLGDDGRAYSLAQRTRNSSSSWSDAAAKLRRTQHRRLVALAKVLGGDS